jgi:hypothetical protein
MKRYHMFYLFTVILLLSGELFLCAQKEPMPVSGFNENKKESAYICFMSGTKAMADQFSFIDRDQQDVVVRGIAEQDRRDALEKN